MSNDQPWPTREEWTAREETQHAYAFKPISAKDHALAGAQ